MVVPVPVVLHEGDVKTLSKDVFAHVEQMGAPRLVEYWEQDPCEVEPPMTMAAPTGAMAGRGMAREDAVDKDLGVKIEAKFVVGEYQVVVLSATDSTGLDTWLHRENYKIPDGAEPLLRPYVESGMKFFVAKVDPTKVKFENGRAALSPLRFYYDSEDFSLPIRLGLANSSGTQDLIVNIFSPNQRYEVANYKNVTIPTNIDVDDSVRGKFGAFYATLYDKTLDKTPGAVVTEYAWQATTCDPCPGPTLQPDELMTLGGDVLGGTKEHPTPENTWDLVMTRLHARYGKDIKDDLAFKQASPIVGGREFLQTDGKLEEGAKQSTVNNFQGRYAIRHEWTGPIRCEKPIRHRWGGPPAEIAQKQQIASGPVSATNIAFAPRGEIQLPKVVKRDLPEIDVRMAGDGQFGAPTNSGTLHTEATQPAAATDKKSAGGCGCETGGDTGRNDAAAGALIVAAAVLSRRRRKA
jgi:MYXO-CTERM domain-containing protein